MAASPRQPGDDGAGTSVLHFCTVAVTWTVRLVPWQSFEAPAPILSDPAMTSRWLSR